MIVVGLRCDYPNFQQGCDYSAFQGTSAMALVGLVASLKVSGATLTYHTFLFLGVGEINQAFCVKYHANK